MNLRNLLFIGIFLIAAVFASQINFSAVVGAEGQNFTVFQFFAPTAGAFLGLFGIIIVLLSQLVNVLVASKAIGILDVLRFFPILFAVYYFSRKKHIAITIAVPILCMALFWLNPVGRAAWPFALFWLIPIIAHLFSRSLLWKSFGATFTAHAVGSTLWLYTVPMAPATWIGLMPQVLFERSLFAFGIAGSYWLLNLFLNVVTANWKVPILQLEKLPWRLR
jgi:hypothetical protein